MTARVTIVTRTRDREVLLARALRSVSRQTFTDYELVVVNDAGDPLCVERALEGVPEDFRARVKVVNSSSSAGREAALEAGLNASHGEFFAIHDDDDSWAPGFLQACVAELDEHPEYGAVATRCTVVHEHLDDDGALVEDSQEVLAADTHCWSLLDTMVANYVPPISQLIRRQVADEIGHWDGTLQTQADWDFNIRLLTRTTVGFLPDKPLAYWHQRPPQGDSLGNSVVDHAHQHLVDNAAIRDRFVRESAASGGIGGMLVSAAYFQRLERRLVEAESGVRRLEALVFSRDDGLAGVKQDLKDLRSSVDSLHGFMGNVLESLESLHGGMGQELRITQEIHQRVNQNRVLRAAQKVGRSAKRLRRGAGPGDGQGDKS